MTTRIEHQLTLPLEAAGRRLDQAMAELLPQYSRSRLGTWVREGRALLNGQKVKPSHAVVGGETLQLIAELELDTRVEAEDLPIQVRHEDASVLVIDKPAGLVVHPGAGNRQGTLQNALLHRYPELAALPRAGIVHRLDKDTTGLMVVARTLEAHHALVDALSARTIRREYLALVQGAMVAGGTVNAPIGRHPVDRLRQAVRPDDQGRPAVTHYRVERRFPSHTLLHCRLETGRTHQIRVHLAHVGHPIVGDPLYGGRARLPGGATVEVREALSAFRRQALHAWKLAFEHPETGAEVAFEAPLPADFQALLALLSAAPRSA